MIKYQQKQQEREFFCNQFRAILNLFTVQWLKCALWNNTCFDRISTSGNCSQKKKLVLKMHLLVILLDMKTVCDWRTKSQKLQIFCWYMGTDVKCWLYLLSWKQQNRQLRKFHVTNIFCSNKSRLRRKKMENTNKKQRHTQKQNQKL